MRTGSLVAMAQNPTSFPGGFGKKRSSFPVIESINRIKVKQLVRFGSNIRGQNTARRGGLNMAVAQNHHYSPQGFALKGSMETLQAGPA